MLQRLQFFVGIFFILFLQVLSDSTNTIHDDKNQNKQFPPFGRAMRQEFLLAPTFVNLNHGAYGTYPRYVRDALHVFQDRAEANSDLWMRREAKTELANVRNQLAQVVNALAEDIVMVPNATSGMNAVLRSILFRAGEQILHVSTIYNSMQSIIRYIQDNSNGTVLPLQYNLVYPISNDEIVSSLEAFVDEHHTPENPIRLALIDHISSTPGVIMPIERIIPMLKQRNILVLIDGAHAVGQIPIDLTQLAPDYYITNCHKWLYSARGSSILYVAKQHQSTIHAGLIASGYARPSRFQDEFFWTGTMDYSPYMSVTAALEFRRLVGGENAIREYTHDLAMRGGQYLAQRFGTEVLQEEEQMGSLVDVRLPLLNPENELLTADFWIDTLLYRFPEVYSSPYKHGGKWWIRVSSQIYNDLDDFEVAANVFQFICAEINGNVTVTA